MADPMKNFRKAWNGKGVGAGTTTDYMTVNMKNVILPVIAKTRDAMSGGVYASLPHYVGLEDFTLTLVSQSDLGEDIKADTDGLYNFEIEETLVSYNALGDYGTNYGANKTTVHTFSGVLESDDGGTLDHRATETTGPIVFQGVKYKRVSGTVTRYDIDKTADPPVFMEDGQHMFQGA